MSAMRDAGNNRSIPLRGGCAAHCLGRFAQQKNGLGKALLIVGALLAFLFTVKSFGMSFGQGLPHPPKGDATQAARQTVSVNEKLQRGTGTLPLAAKLKTASGGSDKKLRRVIGGSILETWNSTGDPLRISVKSPLAGRFLQTDPIGYQDSMNLYQAFIQNPNNYWDPFGLSVFNVFITYDRDSTMNSFEYQRRFTRRDSQNRIVEEMLFKAQFPKWENLKNFASIRGHDVNIVTQGDLIMRNIEGNQSIVPLILESLAKEDTSTFIIGHSRNYLTEIDIRFGKIPNDKPILTNNNYVGVFTCNSNLYACNLFETCSDKGFVFSIANSRTTDMMNIEWAAYAVIESLINRNDMYLAIAYGNYGLQELTRQFNEFKEQKGIKQENLNLVKDLDDKIAVDKIKKRN